MKNVQTIHTLDGKKFTVVSNQSVSKKVDIDGNVKYTPINTNNHNKSTIIYR